GERGAGPRGVGAAEGHRSRNGPPAVVPTGYLVHERPAMRARNLREARNMRLAIGLHLTAACESLRSLRSTNASLRCSTVELNEYCPISTKNWYAAATDATSCQPA